MSLVGLGYYRHVLIKMDIPLLSLNLLFIVPLGALMVSLIANSGMFFSLKRAKKAPGRFEKIFVILVATGVLMTCLILEYQRAGFDFNSNAIYYTGQGIHISELRIGEDGEKGNMLTYLDMSLGYVDRFDKEGEPLAYAFPQAASSLVNKLMFLVSLLGYYGFVYWLYFKKTYYVEEKVEAKVFGQ